MQSVSVKGQNAPRIFTQTDSVEATRLLTSREREAILRAGAIIAENLSAPPALVVLAESVGLSQRRVTQGFRELFGSTLFGYLRECRLLEAQRLLQETDMPLKQIAFHIGYGHANNLIAAYRDRFGVPPRRYARAIAEARLCEPARLAG